MNKRASVLATFILFILVLVSCMLALYLMVNNNSRLLGLTSDVEGIFSARLAKETNLLQMKLALDDIFVKSYEKAIIQTASADVQLSSGVPLKDLDTYNKISIFFFDRVNSLIKASFKDQENFDVGMDLSQDSFILTRNNFNFSSKIAYTFKYYEGKFHILETRRETVSNLILNYSSPLSYQISFAELGLDSYSDLTNVLDTLCSGSKQSEESLRNCLKLNLLRWRFDADSVSKKVITDEKGNSIDEYYTVNFTTEKIFFQFDPPKPISFLLETSA
jgi:hypothetical protein